MQKRILVVDDDEMNLKRTKVILSKCYGVLLAESGEEALQILEKEKVDLVLLETFEHIKNRQEEIPVIFLTASGYENDVLSAINLGAVNYLKKPFFPQELLKRVAKEFTKK